MARVQLLLCFTLLFSAVSLLDIVSAHLKIKPTDMPQIEDPKTVKDVEPYTVKVVMVFVSDLEKECPKTNKFKAFFGKLRAFAKYVCPIKSKDEADYDKDMKAKAGGLLRTISSFAVGKIKEEIQEEKQEAINTFKFMRFLATKILGGDKKEENKETMELTAEQQKEIKEGILRWKTIITKITNTMLVSPTSSSSDDEDSTSGGEESSNGKSKSSGGSTDKDTTGSDSNMGAPSGSPSSSPSGSTKGSGVMISPSGSMTIPKGSPMNSPSGSSSSSPTESESSTKGSAEGSQNSTMTVTEVEAETSKEVMTFIMNLEKKCPQKEEYKSFFEKLKATMTAPPKIAAKGIKGFLSGIKSAGGKLSEAMTFMRSRIGSKSAEVKQSLENYQGEVMKTLQELETIHNQIVNQNKDKKDGSLTVTTQQRTEIKQTITKWEQVTTQFVETAIQSETQSSSDSSTTLGKALGKINLPNSNSA